MHPLEKIANKWTEEENKFFESQDESKDIFQLELTGNKRTGDQIEDWNSPGSQKIEELYNNWDGKSQLDIEISEGGEIKKFDDLLIAENVPEQLPEIGQMVLYKSSKVTDFIKGSFLEQYGLIVSENIKNILANFNLGEHKYFHLNVKHKNDIHKDYWFLRSSACVGDNINFKKTKFYTQDDLLDFSSRKPTEINSIEELKAYNSEVSSQDIYIKASEIYLNADFPKYDLFYSKQFGINGIFVSEKLKSELTKSTGIVIKTTKRIKTTGHNIV